MKKEGFDIYVSFPGTDVINKIGYASSIENITDSIRFYMESIDRPVTQLETILGSNGINTHTYKFIEDLLFISKREVI